MNTALRIRLQKFTHHSIQVSSTLNWLAVLYRDEGNFARSRDLYKEFIAIQEDIFGPEHPDVATNLVALANIDVRISNKDEAHSLILRAAEIFRQHVELEQAQSAPSNYADIQRIHDDVMRILDVDFNGKVAGEDQQLAAEMFLMAQTAQQSLVARALARLSERLAAGSTPIGNLLRQKQDKEDEWEASAEKLASALGANTRNDDFISQLQMERLNVKHQIGELDDRILSASPNCHTIEPLKPISMANVQPDIGDDEARLFYLTASDHTWLWFIRGRGKGFHLFKLDIGASELKRDVSALRATLDPEFNRSWKAYPATNAYQLYSRILAPAEPYLQGVHSLLVIPDGALQSLPLGVLVTRPPQRDPNAFADYAQVSWLAREYAISVIPAVSSIHTLRLTSESGHAPKPFVGVGDPTLEGTLGRRVGILLASLFRGGAVDVDAVRKLPPLPETATELKAIATIVHAGDQDLLLGPMASEPILRNTPLSDYKAIEFATQGVLSGDIRGLTEPALVLTPPAHPTPDNDGLLTASKIATLRLNADWVILSACNTASADGTLDAGGLSALARAFFFAGARSLVVSHWAVVSDAAVQLTTGMFSEISSSSRIGRAEALRRSMMAMMDHPENLKFEHPMSWAPFELVGDGGRAP